MRTPTRVLVTGAGGFVGGRLVAALLADYRFAGATLTLSDRALADAPDDPRVTRVEGDFGDPTIRGRLLANLPDLVFHLAGILGGAAEADYALARRVNIGATLALIEALRDPAAPPRLVFASSIAVFGPPLPPLIDDATPPAPLMTYGAHKRMIEVAIEQFSARGWIDGVALRLPGIVARPNADARLKSAFLNAMFHQVATGADVTLPVSPDGTTWLLSVDACAAALLHGGLVDDLGRRRALTLPAQGVRFDALVAALRRRYPDSPSAVAYAPDAAIQAQFGSQPALATPLADALGFVHDGDLDALVARALPAGATL